MKVFIVLCSLIVVISATPTKIEDPLWEQFKLDYDKTYVSIEEELQRYDVFIKKLKKIDEHNKLYEQGLSTYKKGVNQFTDWTHEEFVNYLRTFPRPEHSAAVGTFVRPLNVVLPPSIDWRDKHAVTPVQHQGNCFSCWAFSTIGALEGQNAIVNNQLVPLSAQELVNCAKECGGCGGCNKTAAFDYVKKSGLSSAKDYPYEANDGKCRRDDKPAAIHITGYKNIASGDEDGLEAAVASIGPVSVGVSATDGWDDYHSGIFTDECPQDFDKLNHAVLVVGYGTENSQDYWIVKNSWGSSWGENGYIRLARHQNKCGIALAASYPLMK